jgi:hypothetical protein
VRPKLTVLPRSRLYVLVSEETPVSRLYISALTIGLSYFLGGLCPLLPYFFVTDVAHGLMFSSAVTLVILLLFGVAKTHFTGATGGVGGYLYGAVSTMMVGGLAGASSFLRLASASQCDERADPPPSDLPLQPVLPSVLSAFLRSRHEFPVCARPSPCSICLLASHISALPFLFTHPLYSLSLRALHLPFLPL